MSSLQVHLTDEHNKFLAQRIGEGQYSSTDEAIRAAIDLLQREEQEDREKLEWLRAAIAEGDASGIAEGDVFARVRRKVGLPPERL